MRRDGEAPRGVTRTEKAERAGRRRGRRGRADCAEGDTNRLADERCIDRFIIAAATALPARRSHSAACSLLACPLCCLLCSSRSAAAKGRCRDSQSRARGATPRHPIGAHPCAASSGLLFCVCFCVCYV